MIFSKTTFISLLLLSFTVNAKVIIYDAANNQRIDYDSLIRNIPLNSLVVLGEYHYTESIQQGQAQIISDLIKLHQLKDQFTVGWEFLNYIDQAKIDQIMIDYKANVLSDNDLFKRLFPNSSNSNTNFTYLPIFQAVKKLNGNLLGTNVPRSLKQQIIKQGLEAIDPALIPPNWEPGNENYFLRFKQTMSGHVPPALIDAYFVAQCFTDAVMSHQLTSQTTDQLSFLIVGSFHSDYNDGVVDRLQKLNSNQIVSIKLIDGQELTLEEIQDILKPHPIYGALADFIFISNIE